MHKPAPHASRREHKAPGEINKKENSSKVHHHHHKNTVAVTSTREASVERRTPSRGGSRAGVTRSNHVRCVTKTVRYVCGGALKHVELKLPVLRLRRLDIFAAAEIRCMTRSQMARKGDPKEKEEAATRADSKPKVPAVSNKSHIPVRVTRKNSPPLSNAGQACNVLQNKVATKEKQGLQHVQEVEMYDDVSDVPLEEYCGVENTQAEVETGAAKDQVRQSSHRKHKGAPMESAPDDTKLCQPPHKKNRSTPIQDCNDTSDKHGPSEKPSKSASVPNTTKVKVAKAHDKTEGLKCGDTATKQKSSDSTVLNKAGEKVPEEAHSSVKTTATAVLPSRTRSNVASSKPTSKPIPAAASGTDTREKKAVKRPAMVCHDHCTKKLKSDADVAKEKTESETSTSQQSNSSPLLTKKAPLTKPASKPPPCTKNIAGAHGLKETPATELKAGAAELEKKPNMVAARIEQKSCPKASSKTEQDKLGKKPASCGKNGSTVSTGAQGVSRNIPASSSTKIASETTNVRHSSEGAHGSATLPVAKKELPSKLEKKPSFTKDGSSITASKSSCPSSSTLTKDVSTPKTPKGVQVAKASQSVSKKTPPPSTPKKCPAFTPEGSSQSVSKKTPPSSTPKKCPNVKATPQGSPDETKSGNKSNATKAPFPTLKPVNDATKVRPANNTVKVKPASDSEKVKSANDAVKVKPANDVSNVKPANDKASAKPANDKASVKPANVAVKVKTNDVPNVKPANDKASVKPVNVAAKVKTNDVPNVKPANDKASVKPINDTAKVKPVNDSEKAKCANGAAKARPVSSTCASSTVVKEAPPSKPAKKPVSCAKNNSNAPVTASKALTSAPKKLSSDTAKTGKGLQPILKTEQTKTTKPSVSDSKERTVENINSNESKEKKCSEIVAPTEDTLKQKQNMSSTSGTEVKISRSKLPGSNRLPRCSSGPQVPAAEILSRASEGKENEQQSTCVAPETELEPKTVKARSAERTESSISIPDSGIAAPLSSTSERLCETETRECNPLNTPEVTVIELIEQQSILQDATICKGDIPEATEVPTKTAARTENHASEGPPSDILGTVSENAQSVTETPGKDKTYSHKPCMPTVPTEVLGQNSTSLPDALDVKADVTDCVDELGIGAEVECQDNCLNNKSTIKEDGENLQGDASNIAGQSCKNQVSTATPDTTCPAESTACSTYLSGQLDESTSEMVHKVGLLHEPGSTEEEDYSVSSRVNSSTQQAECSTQPSTKMDAEPPAITEVNRSEAGAGTLCGQRSVGNARDSIVSLPKTASDRLSLEGHGEVSDMLPEGPSPLSPFGVKLASASQSDNQMPSAASQGNPERLYFGKASSRDQASAEKLGANSHAAQASQDGFQQVDQGKVAVLQRSLCDIKPTRETCSSTPVNACKWNIGKTEETTVGAVLEDLINEVVSNTAKGNIISKTEETTVGAVLEDLINEVVSNTAKGNIISKTEETTVGAVLEDLINEVVSNTAKGNICSKTEETTVGAVLEDLINEVVSNTAKGNICSSIAVGGGFQESEKKKSDLTLHCEANATKCLMPSPTGEGEDSESGIDICHPTTDEVILQQAKDSGAATQEQEVSKINSSSSMFQPKHVIEMNTDICHPAVDEVLQRHEDSGTITDEQEKITSTGTQLPQQLSSEVADTEMDGDIDQMRAEEPNTAFSSTGLPSFPLKDDTEMSAVGHPATDEVPQKHAEDSLSATVEQKGISDTSSELPQRSQCKGTNTKINGNEGDPLAGCENSDLQAKQPNTTSPPEIHSGLGLSQPSDITVLNDGYSSDRQQETLKDGPAEEAHINLVTASSPLKSISVVGVSDCGSDITASKRSLSKEDEATLIEQHRSEGSVNTTPSCNAPSPDRTGSAQTTDTSLTDETGSAQMNSCMESSEEVENVPGPSTAVTSNHNADVLEQSPPKKKKKRKRSGSNTSLHSAWIFSGRKRAKRPPKRTRKHSTKPADPPVVEAAVANGDEHADPPCSRLDTVDSTKERLPSTSVEVGAASEKATLSSTYGNTTSDEVQGVGDSKLHRHDAAPCAKTSDSHLNDTLLELDLTASLNILDVCGSQTEDVESMRTRIMNKSITKNDALAEVAQSVHRAVLDECFKRERAVRTLNLLRKIPFSLNPHDVVKIRKLIESVVDQSQTCAKVKLE